MIERCTSEVPAPMVAKASSSVLMAILLGGLGLLLLRACAMDEARAVRSGNCRWPLEYVRVIVAEVAGEGKAVHGGSLF